MSRREITDDDVARLTKILKDRGPGKVHKITLAAGTGEITVSRLPTEFMVHHRDGAEVDGWIYFVRAGEFVKIGFAKEVADRLPRLQTGSPVKLELLMAIEGKASLERDFHRKFASLRAHGEWFTLDGALSAYLDRFCLRQQREMAG
ncbi:MAG: GIY-YIG nuclease family protein [Mesorhizobium sp.]|uniref:GIY-YIG nuclease family protein n=1 Tax=unclassified Mesorhizobium TaxID=325217 RepID=UPI000FCA3A34|nr:MULTISPECIES: GIY-YIG nuclease family protein [unclassified Mesorhizobium]RUW04012.1 GIY-YIG nuclease family protein [Mesorhizobium sp. M1A.F.Ca.IN.020.04.1.1]RUW04075.1 GIY-YIG nuclease family protein [Mesorhizobium sp. M1A.F.Ca.IN.020.04.1.1]TIN82726.1 MAG: GIY-YIG nuclease family protein [Mesorhizobium sp.]TIN88379.1 MAG: GIY-YIG nuclease family protein [Mesorhizobium sp.]TIO69579.1 MAG: GIY-YIG nuclease family protein [Mesorhizobium sp.]